MLFGAYWPAIYDIYDVKGNSAMLRHIVFGAVAAILLAGLSSCALWRNWRGAEPVAVPVSEEASVTADDWKAQVTALVKRQMGSAAGSREADQQKVVRRQPYYFKEYAVYPEDSREVNVELTETDSRSKPCIANAKVAKVRYATRLHRNRSEAERDANFLRDTGTETITYELRNGRWTRVGSL